MTPTGARTVHSHSFDSFTVLSCTQPLWFNRRSAKEYPSGAQKQAEGSARCNVIGRCDVRNATRTVAIVAVLAWLSSLRAREQESRAKGGQGQVSSTGESVQAPEAGGEDGGNGEGGGAAAGHVDGEDERQEKQRVQKKLQVGLPRDLLLVTGTAKTPVSVLREVTGHSAK